jgi:hypothetical protein
MDESGITQNRRSRRSHLLMAATLEVSGRAISVKLRNLSSEGAQVEGDQLPVEGTELLFRKGELAVAGSIIWTKGKHAGIRFVQKLEPQAVLNHIAVPRPRMDASFRRPGLASRALTEQERKLAENWIPVVPLRTFGD